MKSIVFRFIVVSVFVFSLAAFCGCTINVGLKKEALALDSTGAKQERVPLYEHGDWVIARGSLHNHTTYSDGCRSADDLLELARIQGIAVLSYNDHREGKLCAGKSGKICARTGGVEDYGYAQYYEHLLKVQERAESQGMIAMKGIEVIPYFYNYGKFPHLVLDGLQHHFTVYGIKDPAVFESMPTRDLIPLGPESIPDEEPWQKWLDYMVEEGAIVHAVHVEEGGDQWYGPAHGACPPVPKNLHRLEGLRGFSVLPSAWHEQTGGPGGLWDTVLIEYMAGLRDKPLWAAADADYHCDASLAIATTLLYMREFSEDEVYNCLRQGRMVALQGDAFQDVYVSEWWISDSGKPAEKIMLGRELRLSGTPTIRFALDHPVEGCRTRLIRNGVVIHEVQGTELTYTDRQTGVEEPAFYRVEVTGPVADRGAYEGPTMPHSELFVNPIFVRYGN